MTIQRIFRCHRQNFLDMRRVSLYGRTSQNTCKCASSACFPYIICFVRSSQNPEEVRTCQQHCLWFIQICFGQSWAPVLQQQLFCMFKWAFLYVLCTFHVLWASRNFGGSENTLSEFPTIVSHFLGPILCSKAAETTVCCLIRDKIRSCAPHNELLEEDHVSRRVGRAAHMTRSYLDQCFRVFCSVRSNQLQKMWKNQNNPENIEAPWDNVSDTRRIALSRKTRSHTHSGAGKFSNQAVSM